MLNSEILVLACLQPFHMREFQEKIPSCVNIDSAVSAGARWFDQLSTFNMEVNYVNPPSLFFPVQKLNALIANIHMPSQKLPETPKYVLK